MKPVKQTTLFNEATLSGIGVHSGRPVTMTLCPAKTDTGIIFSRAANDGSINRDIRADLAAVSATELAIVMGDGDDSPIVSSVEHVLAALGGLGVDNAIIRIDGPEIPIMDGSAMAMVEAIDQAGIRTLDAQRRYIEITKSIRITKGDASAEFYPHAHGFRVEVAIDFDHPLVGRQNCALDVEPQAFRKELAPARTFGFVRDVSRLWSSGYALGSSLENTVVVADDRILNPEGLRYADEFARHKALDVVGDLMLAGAPMLGGYRSVRGGHRLNYGALCALMTDKSAWRMIPN